LIYKNEQNKKLGFYQFDDIGSIQYATHVYTEGERLDDIAHQYYKRPHLWWIIPEYNPELTDFHNIAPGTRLRIPLNV